jgi:hypothetical protein
MRRQLNLASKFLAETIFPGSFDKNVTAGTLVCPWFLSALPAATGTDNLVQPGTNAFSRAA